MENTQFDRAEFIPHILNENNKLITAKVIEKILLKYGIKHKVKNINQFQNAMIHESYLTNFPLNEKTAKLIKEVEPISSNLIKSTLPLQDKSYEVLEFLGDAVIHNVLARYLYKNYHETYNKDQGFLTKLRTKIEKGDTLAKLARVIGLPEYAIFARNIELQGGRVNNEKIMEDMFEAFIGALCLEAPFELCDTFISTIIFKEIDMAELINTEDNYKEALMQYYHKIGAKDKLTKEKYTPKYKQVSVIDDPPRRQFKMCVLDNNGDVVGVGIANSKKGGEQQAAYFALVKYGVLKEINDINNSDDNEYICDDNAKNIEKNKIKTIKNDDDVYGYLD